MAACRLPTPEISAAQREKSIGIWDGLQQIDDPHRVYVGLGLELFDGK